MKTEQEIRDLKAALEDIRSNGVLPDTRAATEISVPLLEWVLGVGDPKLDQVAASFKRRMEEKRGEEKFLSG